MSTYTFPSDYQEIATRFYVHRSLEEPRIGDGASTQLRLRSRDFFSTSRLDYPLYKKYITDALEGIDRDEPILEVGAGDGRITEILLNIGFKNIIVSDINPHGLYQLYNDISTSDRAKIHFIVVDIFQLPLFFQQFTVIVAIEVLQCLEQHFQKGLDKLAGLLIPGGRLLHSELMFEGNLVYALAHQDWAQVRSLLDNSSIPSGKIQVRVAKKDEMDEAHRRAGLVALSRHSIPSEHGLAISKCQDPALPEAEQRILLQCIASSVDEYSLQRACFYVAVKQPEVQER